MSEPETDASCYFVGMRRFPPFPDLGGHIIGAEAVLGTNGIARGFYVIADLDLHFLA